MKTIRKLSSAGTRTNPAAAEANRRAPVTCFDPLGVWRFAGCDSFSIVSPDSKVWGLQRWHPTDKPTVHQRTEQARCACSVPRGGLLTNPTCAQRGAMRVAMSPARHIVQLLFCAISACSGLGQRGDCDGSCSFGCPGLRFRSCPKPKNPSRPASHQK